MEKEHRHLELNHEHPAHGEGEHAHDHPHLPEWFPRQRELHDKVVLWDDVSARYIFGCDGYFYAPHDWFFAAITRQGPRLQVYLRLNPADLEKVQSLSHAEEHPMKTPGWIAINVDDAAAAETALKWLQTAYETAKGAPTKAPASKF